MKSKSFELPARKNLQFPIGLLLFFYLFGALMWLLTKNPFFLFDLPFIGTSVFTGIMLANFLPKRYQFWGRIATQFLIGNCPMDLKIREYIEKEEGKINSTECILCSVCRQVCPTKAIALKFCPSVSTQERLNYRI